MLELIERLRILLNGIGFGEEVRPGTVEASMLTSKDWTRIRGMHDLLLSMEERIDSLRMAMISPGSIPIDTILTKV